MPLDSPTRNSNPTDPLQSISSKMIATLVELALLEVYAKTIV